MQLMVFKEEAMQKEKQDQPHPQLDNKIYIRTLYFTFVRVRPLAQKRQSLRKIFRFVIDAKRGDFKQIRQKRRCKIILYSHAC